ncbi:sugar ABC transporter permease [Oscillospiraceae bacterium HV4-5-C5C]|nr:sugar ABC transporter permease [Oscillospiraceae bacterium HV4-5-C5C]
MVSRLRQKLGLNSRLARREAGAALLFLLPSLLGIGAFFLLPFLDTIRRSFYDVLGQRFVGVASYQSVLQNQAFQLASINTARFITICIPLLLALSMLLALLVRAVKPAGRTHKTLFLLPMAVPVASLVLLWQALFSDRGLVNGFLARRGQQPVSFMESSAAFWVLIVTYLWKNSGYDMILWLAGLDGISDSLYDAAHVDGAGWLQTFRFITLPSLAPTVGLVAILSLLSSFNVFREAYLVAGSYPHDSIYQLQHLFNNWFVKLEISRLCAAAVLLALVLLIFILLLLRLFRDRTE